MLNESNLSKPADSVVIDVTCDNTDNSLPNVDIIADYEPQTDEMDCETSVCDNVLPSSVDTKLIHRKPQLISMLMIVTSNAAPLVSTMLMLALKPILVHLKHMPEKKALSFMK